MAIRLDTKLELSDVESYKSSSLEVLKQNIPEERDIKKIIEKIDEINKYLNLDKTKDPKDIYTFDDKSMPEEEIKKAKNIILKGKLFFEHACAGEATRLGLGTKYLINIKKELTSEKIAELITEETSEETTSEKVIEQSGCRPEELLSLSLGTRHMMQLSFDISNLAKKNKKDPKEVLSIQKMILILNEKSYEAITADFRENNFFGFDPKNIFFMVQKSFHGINIDKNNDFFYDENSPKRLHNHGQMVMQETMDDEIFFLDPENNYEKKYLKSQEFGEVLKGCEDKISYNIEDIGYLTSSLDYASLATALKMKEEGYNMMMELVLNNPIKPHKGASVYYDPVIGKNVMIETHQLGGMKPEDMKFMNKNFNHFPDPYIAWSKLKEKGLPMPIAVKDDFIYFAPVQGDINFLVKTQFVKRKELTHIKNWKSPVTTPQTILAMKNQDAQLGFKEHIKYIKNN
ncbi:MAG: hypothetical protein ACLFPQ_01125 [Candidatus Woesearchaeota archaeon]